MSDNVSPRARKQISKLAESLVEQDRRLRDLERAPQMGFSSLHGSLPIFGDDDKLKAIVGRQPDGTFTSKSVDGPVPAAPSQLGVEAGEGAADVSWDGLTSSGGVPPADFKTLRVEANLVGDESRGWESKGSMPSPEGGNAVVSLHSGDWLIRGRIVSESGQVSEPGETSSVTIAPPVDAEAIEADLEDARQRIADAQEYADGKFQEYDTGMAEHATNITAAHTRIDAAEGVLSATQSDLDDAKADITSAQSAADQAVADALAAAGVAEGKANFYPQVSAPTGSRRKEGNLWLRTTDYKLHYFDAATDTWVESTDQVATQAAADAAQAVADAADLQSKYDLLVLSVDGEGGLKDRLETAENVLEDKADATLLPELETRLTDAFGAGISTALDTAAADATSKANAAQAAAEAEADRLAKAEAQAAQSAAEATAAQDALAKANAARDAAIASSSDDATAKANAAQAAAETAAAADAKAKADAAQAEAIRQAALDATAKADAAKTAAENAAKDYADQQDVILKGEAAADAQEKADAVLAQANDLMARAITQGQNLIVDGSFEEGDANWSTSVHQFTASVGNEARTGSRVMVLDIGSGNRWPRTSSYVPIEEGRTYRLSAWFKVATGTTGNIGFVPRLHHSGGVSSPVVGSTSGPTVEDGWTRLTFDWTCDYDGAYRVQFAPWAGSQADSILWVDDFTAYDITEAKAALDAAHNALTEAEDAHAAAGGAWDHADAAMSRAGAAETNAKDHADNLPKVLHGTGAPSGTAPNGSIWWQHQGALSGPVIGQWNRVNGQWRSTPIDSEAIANLDVGKLTAGSAEIAEAVIDLLWARVVRTGLLEADEALIGGTLLKDGAVTAEKITATREMITKLFAAEWAYVAERLVVDGEIIAANATVINAALQNLSVTERADFVEAFANELFADEFTARSAVLARAIVAAPNLIPNWSQIHERLPDGFEAWGYNSNDPSIYANSSGRRDMSTTFSLAAGETYVFSVDVRSTVEGNRFHIPLRTSDGHVRFALQWERSSTEFTTFEAEITVDETRDDYYLGIQALLDDEQGFHWFRNMRLERMLDGRLTVPGSIDVGSLNVTEEMVAAFARILHLVVGDIETNLLWADQSWQNSAYFGSTLADYIMHIDGQGLQHLTSFGEPLIQLGNFDEMGLTLRNPGGQATASMTDDGHVTGQIVSANQELYYRGDELTDILTQLRPQIAVAYGERDMSGISYTNPSHVGFLELSFDAEPGRQYQLTVEPYRVQQAQFQRLVITNDGTSPSIDMDTTTSTRRIYTTAIPDEVGGGTFRIDPVTTNSLIRVLIGVYSGSSGINFPNVTGNVVMTVQDLGQAYENTGVERGSSVTPSQPTVPDTKPPVTKTRRVRTYTMSWWRTWWQNGTIPPSGVGSSEMVQGRTPYFTAAGLFRSMVGFPSMTADLAGEDIEKIEVRVRVTHTHAGSGGNVRLGTHSNTSRPATWSNHQNLQTTNTHFGRGQERWVALPSSMYAGFKNGTRRGIVMYSSSTSTLYYVQADPSRFAIRVTSRG